MPAGRALLAELSSSTLRRSHGALLAVPGTLLWSQLRAKGSAGSDLLYCAAAPEAVLLALGRVSGEDTRLETRVLHLIRQWAAQEPPAPPEMVLAQISDSLCREATDGGLRTLTLGLLDLRSAVLRLAVAGRAASLRLRNEAFESLGLSPGPRPGLKAGSHFRAREISLRPDDRLVLLADTADGTVDTAALKLSLARLEGAPPAKPGAALCQSIDRFTAAAEPNDRLTLLVLACPGTDPAPLQGDYRGFPVNDALPGAARHWLHEHGQAQGLAQEHLAALRRALDRIIHDVRAHSGLGAGDEVSLGLARYVDRVELSCTDSGETLGHAGLAPASPTGTDPGSTDTQGTRQSSRALAREGFRYRREGDRNIRTLTLRLPWPGMAEAALQPADP